MSKKKEEVENSVFLVRGKGFKFQYNDYDKACETYNKKKEALESSKKPFKIELVEVFDDEEEEIIESCSITKRALENEKIGNEVGNDDIGDDED